MHGETSVDPQFAKSPFLPKTEQIQDGRNQQLTMDLKIDSVITVTCLGNVQQFQSKKYSTKLYNVVIDIKGKIVPYFFTCKQLQLSFHQGKVLWGNQQFS